MIHFDKHTLEKWEKDQISAVSCTLITGGCAGTKLDISISEITGYTPMSISGSNILCYVDEKDITLLSGAYITYTKGNWILSSSNILSHCGCGKSFERKTGNPKIDKIRLLKAKLRDKNHSHHH